MGTCTCYTSPQIPDADYIHCHSPITSPHQEKWHRSHKVMLDRYRCSAQCKSCADGDALCRPTRLQSIAHDVSTENYINTSWYFVQSGIVISIYCNYGIIESQNSLRWKGQGSCSPTPDINEKSVRGILQELVPALNTNTREN